MTHDYVSTACHHDEHDRCRLVCKFCETDCGCGCHGLAPGDVERMKDHLTRYFDRVTGLQP